MRFSWLYHHLDYLRSIRLDAATLPRPLICNSCARANYPSSRGKHQVEDGRERERDNGQCQSSLPWLQWIAFWAALATAPYCLSFPSLTLTLPLSLTLSLSCSFLLPLEHLELVAAQTIRQPLFWVKTTHRRTNVEHSALVNWQRGERERARGQRSQALPFCAQHYSLNLKLSLKLWSISRFTAPKCRKFAHSFGSLVGNLSKSIIYIHTYHIYRSIYYFIYIFKCLEAMKPRLLLHVHQAKPSDCKLAMQSFQFPSFLRLPS